MKFLRLGKAPHRTRNFRILTEGERTLTAVPDQFLVLSKGSTVQYGGSVGTRLLLSISPVNWRARLEAQGAS